MTPKNKADELVGKYKGQILTITPRPNRPNYQSKQCALIAVDEIKEVLNILLDSREHFRSESEKETVKYWQQVRKEIQSL